MGNIESNKLNNFIDNIKLLDIYGENEKETTDWSNVKNDLILTDMVDILPINPIVFFDIVKNIVYKMIIKYTPYLEYIKENNLPHISEKELIKCTIDLIEYIRKDKGVNCPRFHEVYQDNVYSKYMKMALEKNDKIVLIYTTNVSPSESEKNDINIFNEFSLSRHKIIIFPIEIDSNDIHMLFGEKYLKRNISENNKNDLFGRIKQFHVCFGCEESQKLLIKVYKVLKREFDLELDFDPDSLVF